jgi:predicted DNA-binding WGR domain protein/pentose-5-phosphate-3-epimerase
MDNTTRHFEFKDDKSSKFWEIAQAGESVTVRYGKTGTTGQSQTKAFADSGAASKHAQKLIDEKLGKGYVEQWTTTVPAADSVGDSVVTKPAAPKPKKTEAKANPVKPIKPKSPIQDPEASPESLMPLLAQDDAINRLLARHPRASAELLEKLSHSSDKATRQGVAGNPNTAHEVYVKLGQQFPREFLANPALDLLLMVNPGLMEEVPQALLIRLLKQADCPSSLLSWAAGHTQAKVQLAVAMNAKAPEEALAKLRASQHAAVLEALGAPQCSPELAQDPDKAFEQAVKDRLSAMTISELTGAWMGCDIGLAQWQYLPLAFRLKEANGGPPDWGAVLSQLVKTTWTPDVILKLIGHESVGLVVARHPSTLLAERESVLDALAKDPSEWTRRAIADNPATPAAVLEALAKDPAEWVRSNLAENPSTPVPVLKALANDENSSVRFSLVKNPSIPITILEELAKDKDSGVRQSVALHPSIPLAILEKLSKDKNSGVRQSVALNPSTPLAILGVLAKDNDGYVRRCVAENPSTPVDVSQTVWLTLVNDKVSDVRRSVAQNSSSPQIVLEALANDKDSDVRRSVAKNSSTPVNVLESLAEDTDLWVRDSVAENSSTPVAGLAVLAKDIYSVVRSSVASNASAPAAILEALAKDEESNVRRRVAKNHSTSVELLETLAKDTDSDVRSNVSRNPSTTESVLKILAKDKDSSVRKCVAENPQTPPDVLEKLASDKVADVLRGVAGNPNAPLSTLLRLCESTVEGVRKELACQSHRSAQICQMLRKDCSEDVRLAVLCNPGLDQATLDELAVGMEWEKDALAMLEHPNLGAKSAQIIADKLFTAAPTDSPWYRHELSKATAQVQTAVKANLVLSYPSRDPNKAVLEKRPLAAVMALCGGPFVEPSRIVKVAGSTDWLVRAAVARNAGTPPNLLKKLKADAHPLVAALATARHANQAKATSNSGVSDAGAGTFDLNRVVQEVLRRMRADGQGWSCFPLVNSKAWRDHVNIHEFLSWLKRFDEFDEVVELFIGELDDSQRDFFWQLATQSKDGEVRMRLVKNNAIPLNTLEKFLIGESVDVLLVMARKPDVSKDIQSKAEKAAIRLIMKKGRSYREMIARNHACLTEAMRVRLSNDKECYVRWELERAEKSLYPKWMTQGEGLCWNDGCSTPETDEFEGQIETNIGPLSEIRMRLIGNHLDQLRTVFQRELQIYQGCYAFTTGQLTTKDVSNALMWLGYIPGSDKDAPTKSARSTDWLTRLGAALHPGATQGVLNLLKEDVDPDVAQAVRFSAITS